MADRAPEREAAVFLTIDWRSMGFAASDEVEDAPERTAEVLNNRIRLYLKETG